MNSYGDVPLRAIIPAWREKQLIEKFLGELSIKYRPKCWEEHLVYNTKKFFAETMSNRFFGKTAWAAIEKEFPKFKVVKKEDEVQKKISLMKIYNWLSIALFWISFKKIDLRFMDRTTTAGYTMYLGTDWEKRSFFSKWALVEHELGHMRQWRKFSWFYPITYATNLTGYLAIPVCAILSIPWAWSILICIVANAIPTLSMRAYWEWQCFKISLLCYARSGTTYNGSKKEVIERYARLLWGSPYFYAVWPLKYFFKKMVRKYLDGISMKYRRRK